MYRGWFRLERAGERVFADGSQVLAKGVGIVESKLYVGNLSYNTSEQELRDLFVQAGEIQEVILVSDRFTGQPKGFGFVQMVSQVDAEKAIRMFHDQELDGRRMIVNIAKPREERSGGGNRRNDGGGGNRGRY